MDLEEDADAPALSSHTLAALQEFFQEQQQSDRIGEDAEENVAEDWGLSQFWYDESTARLVAAEVVRLIDRAEAVSDSPAAVACVACPSLFTMLKKIYPAVSAHLLEYDRRFSRHGCDFTYYDYNHPEDLPDDLKQRFHVVVADPPYLSEECLEKTNEAVQFLSKDDQNCPLLLLTGSVQQERALKIMNVQPCGFRPSHKKKLGNEFKLFTNYDPEDRLGGWEETSSS